MLYYGVLGVFSLYLYIFVLLIYFILFSWCRSIWGSWLWYWVGSYFCYRWGGFMMWSSMLMIGGILVWFLEGVGWVVVMLVEFFRVFDVLLDFRLYLFCLVILR